MLFLINIFIAFILILLQTTILHHLPIDAKFFDLILILIIYTGFYKDYAESMVIIFISGLLMDSLSGGAFGIYCSTYIWLFFSIKAVVQYVHVKSFLLIPLVMVIAVILENFLIAFSVSVRTGSLNFWVQLLNVTLSEVIWCLIMGSLIYYFIYSINRISQKILQKRVNER